MFVQCKEPTTNDVDQLIEVLQTFYSNLEKLRAMEDPQMLLPGRVEIYRDTLEAAYAAYSQLETVVDELGQELEYQHTRLDEGVKQYGER